MENMDITLAKYVAEEGENISIIAIIDGKQWSIPLSQGSRRYAEIMRQVDAGTLTIAEAD